MDQPTVAQWTFPTLTGFTHVIYTGEVGAKRLERAGGYVQIERWDNDTPVIYKNSEEYHAGLRVLVPKIELNTPVQVLTETFGPLPVAGALKFDAAKPMMDLLFDGCPHALEGVGTVLTYGVKKYGGKHGWKSLDDAVKRYEAALIRHQLAKAKGEKIDPESGLPHSWHIACNALFLAQLESTK